MTDNKRFNAVIMLNGIGEFKHISIEDKNKLFPHTIFCSADLSDLLNELDDEIIELKKNQCKLSFLRG